MKQTKKILENQNLKLRALEPEDLDVLYLWENDTSLWEYSSTITPFSRHILATYIANSHQSIYEVKQVRFIIELIGEKQAIGTIDLYDFEPTHMRAGVGILIDGKYQRKGYANQALELLIDYTFSVLMLKQLHAIIPVKNTASYHLFKKRGFESAGVLKEWNNTAHGFQDVYMMQLLNK